MEKTGKVYVAGHRGLAGSAILRRFEAGGYLNIVTRCHDELDLLDQNAVREFFAKERPRYVVLAAAKVGGIKANDTYRADFIYQNLMIEANVIDAAFRNQVEKLIFLGSSCIYPRDAPQPMKEGHLLTGKVEPTNEPYAIAKIAGIKMCAAYNNQFGTNFMSVVPANLYGVGDSYDLANSHVLPALIRKMHEAKVSREACVVVWGSGNPRRELLNSDDMADACLFLMERYEASDVGEFMNVGVGEDHSIAELATMAKEVVGYMGDLKFDTAMPDGMPRKLLDVSRLTELGWRAKTNLRDGLVLAYEDFRRRFDD